MTYQLDHIVLFGIIYTITTTWIYGWDFPLFREDSSDWISHEREAGHDVVTNDDVQ